MNLSERIRSRIEAQRVINGYICDCAGYRIMSVSWWSDTMNGPQQVIRTYLMKPEGRRGAYWGNADIMEFPTIAAARIELARLAAEGCYMQHLRIVPTRKAIACTIDQKERLQALRADRAARRQARQKN